MNKVLKIIIIIVIIDMVILLGYFYFRSRASGPSRPVTEEYNWVTIDEDYAPKDYIESFIKSDSASKGLLPVYIRDYDQDASILRRFKGSRFARPNKAQLNMMFSGLEDWKLVDLKFKPTEDREVVRTMLYIFLEGNWQVGDSGSLMQ